MEGATRRGLGTQKISALHSPRPRKLDPTLPAASAADGMDIAAASVTSPPLASLATFMGTDITPTPLIPVRSPPATSSPRASPGTLPPVS